MIKESFPIIEKLLETGLNLTQSFFQLLQQESTILAESGDESIDLLNSIIDKKNALSPQIEQLSRQLVQTLSDAQLATDQSGIDDYFNKAKAANLTIGSAHQTWTQLSALSAQCKIMNEQNGATINLLLRHSQRTLNLLKGKPATSDTYTAKGTAAPELYSKPLISI